MKPKIVLEIISANREHLRLNSRMALDTLSSLHKDFSELKDEACIISLALNDSIAYMIFDADYDKAISNSRSVLERFPHSRHSYLISYHLSIIGRCLALSGKHEQAKEALLQSLEISEHALKPTNETISLSADILHDLAMSNDMAGGNSKKTILYLGRALTILSGSDMEIRKGVCLMGLGNVKYSEGKKRAALRYYLKAAKIFEDQQIHNNLAAAYSNMGLSYAALGQMESAEKYHHQALMVRLRIGNNDDIANSYFNLSQFHDLSKDTDKTYSSLLECRNYAAKSANRKIYKDTLLWLESIALSRNDMENVIKFREERQAANL